ncbi:MAG: DUF3305 domain-containing protein [Rhizobiaceae bacterium]
MSGKIERMRTLPLGIVVRRLPGVTRWAKWSWKAVSVLPGAGPANWQVLRKEGDAVEYHAATVTLELHRTDTEAYLTGLSEKIPSIFVILRQEPANGDDIPVEVLLATASPYEAQDYADSGEDIVEKVAMPSGLIAWIKAFIDEHHEPEEFVKRRRDRVTVELVEDGVGDPRIPQLTDVYRSPKSAKLERLH